MGQTSNDAHLLLSGTTLKFFENDFGLGVQNVPSFVPAVGCSTRTFVVADKTIEALELSVDNPTSLRLDPTDDNEGTPDRLWYLGINRTAVLEGTIPGSGLNNATFCLR